MKLHTSRGSGSVLVGFGKPVASLFLGLILVALIWTTAVHADDAYHAWRCYDRGWELSDAPIPAFGVWRVFEDFGGLLSRRIGYELYNIERAISG